MIFQLYSAFKIFKKLPKPPLEFFLQGFLVFSIMLGFCTCVSFDDFLHKKFLKPLRNMWLFKVENVLIFMWKILLTITILFKYLLQTVLKLPGYIAIFKFKATSEISIQFYCLFTSLSFAYSLTCKSLYFPDYFLLWIVFSLLYSF